MIELKNIFLAYNKDYSALFDINWKVEKGDRIAIVGEQGSGKTALLRLIAGLEKQTKGEAYILDTPIRKIDFQNFVSLGFLSHKPVFFTQKTVYQNLEYVLKVRGVNKNEIAGKVDKVLQEYGINNLRNEVFGTLCYLDAKLVQIARLALRPLDILLVDEIFSNKNVQQDKIKHALDKLIKSNSKNLIVIFATEDEKVVSEYIKNKRILKSGSFEE